MRTIRLCLYLSILVFCQLSAEEDTSRNHKELKSLAERLETFGYKRSALHYYELLQRDPKLAPEMRSEVEKKVSSIKSSLSEKDKQATLPQIDAFPSFKIAKKVQEAEKKRPTPAREFPHTRINKKKWIITGIVIVGVGVIAYKVNRNLRKKEQSQLSITF